MAALRVLYYTDPACPRSWAAEPALRRLESEFGEQLSFIYVMAGRHREIERPLALLREWLDAAADSGMPIDPRLWLAAPPRSSHPACLAVKAAAEQRLDGAYLRRAREGLAFGGRRLDRADGLLELARTVPELNAERFAIDLGSHAIVEAFGADLERARAGGAGTPRLEFSAGDAPATVVGADALADADALAAAALAAGAAPRQAPEPSVEQALRAHGRLATAEIAAACRLPGPRAAAELWRLATEWRVRAERHLSGETWVLA
jgi:putative protein-disulfide isomerase